MLPVYGQSNRNIKYLLKIDSMLLQMRKMTNFLVNIVSSMSIQRWCNIIIIVHVHINLISVVGMEINLSLIPKTSPHLVHKDK